MATFYRYHQTPIGTLLLAAMASICNYWDFPQAR